MNKPYVICHMVASIADGTDGTPTLFDSLAQAVGAHPAVRSSLKSMEQRADGVVWLRTVARSLEREQPEEATLAGTSRKKGGWRLYHGCSRPSQVQKRPWSAGVKRAIT
jgi:hypothetical protein